MDANVFTAQILRTARKGIRFCLVMSNFRFSTISAHQQHPATRLSQQTCNFCGMLWDFCSLSGSPTFRRRYQAKSYNITIIHVINFIESEPMTCRGAVTSLLVRFRMAVFLVFLLNNGCLACRRSWTKATKATLTWCSLGTVIWTKAW